MFILFKTYWWSIGTKYIFEKNLVDATSKRPIDILETNCLIGCIWKYSFLKWILKTSFDRRFTKTSIIICICLWQYALKLSWRRLKIFLSCFEDALKKSWRHMTKIVSVDILLDQDVLKTFWKQIQSITSKQEWKMTSRSLQDVSTKVNCLLVIETVDFIVSECFELTRLSYQSFKFLHFPFT